MKFWQESIEVLAGLNLLFKKRFLQVEIILLAEDLCHATVIVFERADRQALCQHPMDIESALLKCLL